jgi:3-deoxy-D-manno-octulosonic-acid transferase
LTGPHYFNFQTITEQFLANDAVLCVDENTLAANVSDLLNNPQRREKMGAAAYQLVQQNQGATQRMLALLDAYV